MTPSQGLSVCVLLEEFVQGVKQCLKAESIKIVKIGEPFNPKPISEETVLYGPLFPEEMGVSNALWKNCELWKKSQSALILGPTQCNLKKKSKYVKSVPQHYFWCRFITQFEKKYTHEALCFHLLDGV